MNKPKEIKIWGAKEHNLKNINVSIPQHSLTVITGLSGSGKSSLAFDTLYAEGQRRYIETFSSYARNFLGVPQRPNVDKITGLSPVISIEQKTINKNPRSTVGTITEIYDFLRLLYARIAVAYDYNTGERMKQFTEEEILIQITQSFLQQKILILAPKIQHRKGHYKDFFETQRKKGMLYARIDGELLEITPGLKLNRYQNHDIEIVIDKLKVKESDIERLRKSVSLALKEGDGILAICSLDNVNKLKFFSKKLMSPSTGLAYKEPAPNNFSFNSNKGACPHCKGLGYVNQIDEEKIVPNKKLSIYEGALLPIGKYKPTLLFFQIDTLLRNFQCDLKTPYEQLPQEAIYTIFNGASESFHLNTPLNKTFDQYKVSFNGIIDYVNQISIDENSSTAQKWVESFSSTITCPSCNGARLNLEALSFRIEGKNINDLATMDISDLQYWLSSLEKKLTTKQQNIAHEILKELTTRLSFLNKVGLDYLSLSRSSTSLSGGESQRIRLATQIGSQLVNVLYILDEPSIGLHQKDNLLLIESLCSLRDAGNTVIVVEHDKDMMLAADHLIDLGPKAGRLGGELVFEGSPKNVFKAHTLTAQYLKGEKKIPIPQNRRKGNGLFLKLLGAKGNNLKNIDISFPLNTLTCITGVSGSGKSTLINETLLPILSQHFYNSTKVPLPYQELKGIEYLDKVISMDQSPIGRTPRSNPATYTGFFTDIRDLFVNLPEAKLRGYKPGRFSFNVKGGRCEHCKGNGYRTIEMNFLPNVYVPCESCQGKRYNKETLEIRFKGKSIGDILDLTINQAIEFFENIPAILNKIKTLQKVGLGYLKLGQPSTTLSGGESQRIKIATELSKKDTGKTLYILDEPTTGLHFEDIRILLEILNFLVDRGNTVIIIEHNIDLIKACDYLIDLGPKGGQEGGNILVTGTPEEVAKQSIGFTAQFL